MPLSCLVAPPPQRELHKDGGGGGIARRARAARAPKATSCTTSSATFFETSCAASLTCWRRRRRRWWWCGRGSNVSSSSSRTGGRTCTHPGVDEEGPREPVRRHRKMTIGKIHTFTLPSCAASFTRPPFTFRPPLPLGLQHQQQVSNVKGCFDTTLTKMPTCGNTRQSVSGTVARGRDRRGGCKASLRASNAPPPVRPRALSFLA